MDKLELRRHCLARRESLIPPEVAGASDAVVRRLADWPVVRMSTTIMTYMAFRNELDLSGLFDLLPEVNWVIPRTEDDMRLTLHPYVPGRLVRHRFGMWEPDPTLPVIPPEQVELVLVPGVAFDRRGGRLGLGGGCYDRFLPRTPAVRVGITYDFCLLDVLPAHGHDQRMDWVVTPTQTLRCPRQD